MQEDTYQIVEEVVAMFQRLPECEQSKIMDYLRDRASEKSTSAVPPD